MGILDLTSYLTGIDFLKSRLQQDRQLRVRSTGNPHAFLGECDLKTFCYLSSLRARTLLQYPLVIGFRIIGGDYLYRRRVQKR